jgi:hypothetical protein
VSGATWIVAAGLVLVVAGCGTGGDAADRGDRVSQVCSRHINAQIEAGVVPEADREYATGMCERRR